MPPKLRVRTIPDLAQWSHLDLRPKDANDALGILGMLVPMNLGIGKLAHRFRQPNTAPGRICQRGGEGENTPSVATNVCQDCVSRGEHARRGRLKMAGCCDEQLKREYAGNNLPYVVEASRD
jgi:hypothetical protein